MLARFFKPKWQHPKPAVRIKAVARLRATDQQAHEILCRLALQDKDDTVRLTATEKLLDLPLLIKISHRETVDGVRQQALHRISRLLLKSEPPLDLDVRLDVVQQLTDHDLLCHISLNAREIELASAALEQLRSDSHLMTIAQQCQRAALRIDAATKITCPELLEQLNRQARGNDKSVFRITRDKINQYREEEKLRQQQYEDRGRLLTALQQLAGDEFNNLYLARLSALQQEWQSLSATATSDEQVQFLRFQSLCNQVLDRETQREAAAAEARLKQQQHQQQQQVLQQRLQNLHEKFCTADIRPANLEFLAADLELLQAEYRALQAEPGNSGQLEKLLDQLGQQHDAWRRYESHQDELQQSISRLQAELENNTQSLTDAVRSARKLFNQIDWPDSLSPAPLLETLTTLLAQADQKKTTEQQQKHQRQGRLQQLLDALQSALQEGAVSDAEKLLKRCNREAQKLESLPGRLEQQLRNQTDQLKELQDWQAFAVRPKKEALCLEMEALITSAQPVEQRAKTIKQLQKTWKELDATDPVHDQQIWKRFKQASDQAYAPCDNYFAEQRQLRQQNLEQRQAICQQLEQMLTDLDQLDAEQIRTTLNEARKSWRQFTPVDRAPGKKLQQVFNRLQKQLEMPIKQARKDILQAKQALVERSTDLLQFSDPHAAATEAKQLQAEWKQLGFAPRQLEQPLWDQFKRQCDDIFQRLEHAPDKTDINAALNTMLQRLERLPEQVMSLAGMESLLDEADQLYRQLDSQHPAYTRCQRQLRASIDYVNRQRRAMETLSQSVTTTLQHNSQLCETLEDAILTEADAPALLRETEQQWQPDDALPPELKRAMQQRLNCLRQLLEQPEQLNTVLAEQEIKIRQLCIRLEIACQQPTPAYDQALRMEYQLQRLQQGMEQPDQGFNLQELQQLEYEWLSTAFANHFEALHQRFYDQLSPLLRQDTIPA